MSEGHPQLYLRRPGQRDTGAFADLPHIHKHALLVKRLISFFISCHFVILCSFALV